MLSSCHMISSGLHCFKCCILRWSFCPIIFQLACCAILWKLLKAPVHYISVSERQSVPTSNQISILWHQGQLEGARGKKPEINPVFYKLLALATKKTMAAFFLNPRWLKEEKRFGRFGCRYTFHAIFKTELSRNKTGSSEFCCCTGLGFLICFSKTNSKKPLHFYFQWILCFLIVSLVSYMKRWQCTFVWANLQVLSYIAYFWLTC